MAYNNSNENGDGHMSDGPSAFEAENEQQHAAGLQQQQLPEYRAAEPEEDEIVQVVYQSNQNGSLVAVESSLLTSSSTQGNVFEHIHHYASNLAAAASIEAVAATQTALVAQEGLEAPSLDNVAGPPVVSSSSVGLPPPPPSAQQLQHQQQSRATSTLPSVAEESTGGVCGGMHTYLPEESSTSFLDNHQPPPYDLVNNTTTTDEPPLQSANNPDEYSNTTTRAIVHYHTDQQPQYSNTGYCNTAEQQQDFYANQSQNPIYSTINKQYTNTNRQLRTFGGYNSEANATTSSSSITSASAELAITHNQGIEQHTSNNNSGLYTESHHEPTNTANEGDGSSSSFNTNLYNGQQDTPTTANIEEQQNLPTQNTGEVVGGSNVETTKQNFGPNEGVAEDDEGFLLEDHDEKENNDEEEIGYFLSRHKGGAAESGSFRHNFRKKLGISVSTNENDLTAHRQKLLETKSEALGVVAAQQQQQQQQQQYHQQHQNQNQRQQHLSASEAGEEEQLGSLPKFKRTHSVSFNVGSSRSGRHSVDIRNLPSYLTVKRASIVDVAKGAMSSLIHSFGGGGGSSTIGGSGGSTISSHHQRRDSSPDEEPIFEEPIAPTLSLGQRVAVVKNSGAEFGTVGWIGQLPDVDDDWIVGVIFDNMIGNCDGAHNGIRYFYARENYAMFVPLSLLTKTDNYIGRPETGTMLSRMSVSLKPGQLISIQRSSIRLQHCFLNAPHQRVGHDVRAVSNRLHCQCHNCGPCAHLTKQGRINALPAFGGHHAPNKKNSLAHAAVEILAHHHHHYHEEEHKGEAEDYQFGDNSAHACNFVRYSCCQQTGSGGHDFSADCEMVRPELLDNLIHAPKAPHRRTRPRRRRGINRSHLQQQRQQQQQLSLAAAANIDQASRIDQQHPNINSNFPTLDGTVKSWNESGQDRTSDGGGSAGDDNDRGTDESSYSSCSSSRFSVAEAEGQGGSGVGGGGALNYQTGTYQTGSYQTGSYQTGTYQTGTSGTSYTQYDSSTYQRQIGETTTNNYNTVDTRMSILDQQRFIYQRESSAFSRPHPSVLSDASEFDNNSTGRGIGSSIRRCFACILGRRQTDRSRKGKSHKRRPKKRKLSAKNRINEYRRRQSTFVPSTLAKPQEDFASHGIIMPGPHGPQQQLQHRYSNNSNSDYSSYSRSSCSSSASSPDHHHHHHQGGGGALAIGDGRVEQQSVAHDLSSSSSFVMHPEQHQIQTMTIEHEQAATNNNNEQLKSCQTLQDHGQLNYDDYTFSDGYGSYKKDGNSRESALTDLGYFDSTWNSSSNDTLKQIVDQSINEQVGLPEPFALEQAIAAISPILSQDGSNPSEQVDISSPTASLVDQEEECVCQRMGCLDLEKNPDSPSSSGNQ